MEVRFGNRKILDHQVVYRRNVLAEPLVRWTFTKRRLYSLMLIAGDTVYWFVVDIPGNNILKGKIVDNYDAPQKYGNYLILIREQQGPMEGDPYLMFDQEQPYLSFFFSIVPDDIIPSAKTSVCE